MKLNVYCFPKQTSDIQYACVYQSADFYAIWKLKSDKIIEESSKEMQNNLFLSAAITENINVIKWCIEKCTVKKQEHYDAIKAVDKKGNEALHLSALLNKNHEIVEYLLAKGADREARGIYRRTPFQLAVEQNSN